MLSPIIRLLKVGQDSQFSHKLVNSNSFNDNRAHSRRSMVTDAPVAPLVGGVQTTAGRCPFDKEVNTSVNKLSCLFDYLPDCCCFPTKITFQAYKMDSAHHYQAVGF